MLSAVCWVCPMSCVDIRVNWMCSVCLQVYILVFFIRIFFFNVNTAFPLHGGDVRINSQKKNKHSALGIHTDVIDLVRQPFPPFHSRYLALALFECAFHAYAAHLAHSTRYLHQRMKNENKITAEHTKVDLVWFARPFHRIHIQCGYGLCLIQYGLLRSEVHFRSNSQTWQHFRFNMRW